MGPELYKENGTLYLEESYLATIFWSSSLNLHTFDLIDIVFWWQIFFRKHVKSTPTIGKTAMFWSSTLWSWRSQPITCCKSWQPRPGNTVYRFWAGCHVDAMAAVWQNHIGKNIKITFKWRPSIHNRIANVSMKAKRYQVSKIIFEIVPPFLKKPGSPKLHVYH